MESPTDYAELFPVFSGLLLGSALGYLNPRVRLRAGVLLSVTLGAFATWVSGEFRLSWGFLLFDVPLVAATAAVSATATHWFRQSRKET